MSLDLLDGPAALIVLGGTAVGAVLRAGWTETALTLRALGAIRQAPFRAGEAKAELARQVEAIRSDGLLRAPAIAVGDREFAEATDALLHHRSIPALLAAHEKHKARRMAEAEIAVRTLAQAAELAPVFGMAGTLVALNRMAGEPLAGGAAITAAIGLAIVTTLYGILAANLLLAPLARLVERRARAEEGERQDLVDWLARQVAAACPTVRRPAAAVRGEAA